MRRLGEPRTILTIGIAVAALIFQIGLQSSFRDDAIEGVWFQQWSSDAMMQTVPLQDLQQAPLESLLFTHIQPPALDLVRAALAGWEQETAPVALLTQVDRGLYRLLALLYALTGVALFRWLSRMVSLSWATGATLLFLLHPAALFYATLLETTLATALLLLCLYAEMWRLGREPNRSVLWLAAWAVALCLTRSLFQWPLIVVLVGALALAGLPWRKLLIFALIVGGVALGLAGKNALLFDTFSTSSFSGLNLVRSLGKEVRYHDLLFRMPEKAAPPRAERPSVLTREKKITGVTNLNHERYLEFNRDLLEAYRRHLRETPAATLLAAYAANLGNYFEPSSRYTPHVIVDRLPWRETFDFVFSFPALPLLLLLALIVMWPGMRARPRETLGFLLPALAIFTLCIVGESGENMRFKFFLEPLAFVLLVVALHRAIVRIQKRE